MTKSSKKMTTKKTAKKTARKSFKSFLDSIKKIRKIKNRAFRSYKVLESFVRPLAEKEYNKFKRCSQKHCKKQFDELIEETGKNFDKDMKKVLKTVKKMEPMLTKKYKITKGKIPSFAIIKKMNKDVTKEIKPIYAKYEPLKKELRDCHNKNCKQERGVLVKKLTKKNKKMASKIKNM